MAKGPDCPQADLSGLLSVAGSYSYAMSRLRTSAAALEHVLEYDAREHGFDDHVGDTIFGASCEPA